MEFRNWCIPAVNLCSAEPTLSLNSSAVRAPGMWGVGITSMDSPSPPSRLQALLPAPSFARPSPPSCGMQKEREQGLLFPHPDPLAWIIIVLCSPARGQELLICSELQDGDDGASLQLPGTLLHMGKGDLPWHCQDRTIPRQTRKCRCFQPQSGKFSL